MLARRAHRHVLALKFERFSGSTLAQEEKPGTVDGPVAERAGAREMEGSGGERMREVVAY
jgi:hypothetical protein